LMRFEALLWDELEFLNDNLGFRLKRKLRGN